MWPLEIDQHWGSKYSNGENRDGEVTLEKDLSHNYSYFKMRNLGTSVTSVTVTTKEI